LTFPLRGVRPCVVVSLSSNIIQPGKLQAAQTKMFDGRGMSRLTIFQDDDGWRLAAEGRHIDTKTLTITSDLKRSLCGQSACHFFSPSSIVRNFMVKHKSVDMTSKIRWNTAHQPSLASIRSRRCLRDRLFHLPATSLFASRKPMHPINSRTPPTHIHTAIDSVGTSISFARLDFNGPFTLLAAFSRLGNP
jgi:hypothetical protein